MVRQRSGRRACSHVMVTCELWDSEDLHLPGVAKTPDGRRRLVPESEACNKSK